GRALRPGRQDGEVRRVDQGAQGARLGRRLPRRRRLRRLPQVRPAEREGSPDVGRPGQVSESSAPAGPRWQTQCGIGVALLLVAVVLWFDARQLPPSPAVGVGPSVALQLVGGLVAALGLAHLVAAWRARRQGLAAAADRGNRTSLALVM